MRDLFIVGVILFVGIVFFVLWLLKSILDAFMMMVFYRFFFPIQAIVLGALVWALGFWPAFGIFFLCFWMIAFVNSDCFDFIKTFLLDRERKTV